MPNISSDNPRIVAAQVYIGGIISSEVNPGEEQITPPAPPQNYFSGAMFKGNMFKPDLFVGEPV